MDIDIEEINHCFDQRDGLESVLIFGRLEPIFEIL
jgi:hypothetical protein